MSYLKAFFLMLIVSLTLSPAIAVAGKPGQPDDFELSPDLFKSPPSTQPVTQFFPPTQSDEPEEDASQEAAQPAPQETEEEPASQESEGIPCGQPQNGARSPVMRRRHSSLCPDLSGSESGLPNHLVRRPRLGSSPSAPNLRSSTAASSSQPQDPIPNPASQCLNTPSSSQNETGQSSQDAHF
jgi:hypothetical protein